MSRNIPQLRFAEFSGEWQEEIFGEIAKFSKGKGVSKSDIVANGKIPCIRYGELYTRYGETISEVVSYTNSENDLVYSKANDVIIPSSGETAIDISTASCVLMSGIALGGDINIIRSNNDGVFLAYLLNAKKKQDIANLAQGISVIHLYANQLSQLCLYLPQFDEQQKIGSFLSAVDSKIEGLEQELGLLKRYKQGIMQRLFNQTLRFKDNHGNPFPDWQETNLGRICKITTGKIDANHSSVDGMYRFYTCAKNYLMIDKYAFDTEALLISGNGAYVGYVHYYKGKFNAYQRTYVLDEFTENIIFAKFFLDAFLKNRILAERKEGNTPYIVLSTLSEMPLLIPHINEQKKIADFLSEIDGKIEAKQNQITTACNCKKSLLQKMFV